jgi:hypothetical protein
VSSVGVGNSTEVDGAGSCGGDAAVEVTVGDGTGDSGTVSVTVGVGIDGGELTGSGVAGTVGVGIDGGELTGSGVAGTVGDAGGVETLVLTLGTGAVLGLVAEVDAVDGELVLAGALVTAVGLDAMGTLGARLVGVAAVVGAALVDTALLGAALVGPAVLGAALVVTDAGVLGCACVVLGPSGVVTGRLGLTEGTLTLGTEGLSVGVGNSGAATLTVGDWLPSDVPPRVASAPAGAAIIQTTAPRLTKPAPTRLAIPRRDARCNQRHPWRMPELPQNSPSSPLRSTQRGCSRHVTVEISRIS